MAEAQASGRPGKRRRATPSQLIRGALGLGFPYLLAAVPPDKHITGPLLFGGTLLYIAARVATLFEPETLRRGGGVGVTIGEAVLVSLALAMSLVVMAEAEYFDVGIGGGTIIVIVYLLVHAIAVPILSGWRTSQLETAPERPWLRRFIYVGAFVTEEAIALMCIGMAANMHLQALQGPWGLWDLVPIFPVILLVFFYLPPLWLETAAHPGLSEEDSVLASIEGALLQLGAVLVAAFTGAIPLI